ncbi:Tol biopolymer transport system, TolR protein [hydrothermal vent metagenome]|uniref:Tol biopolymer transport system, TolR protein n=1 Tax=hydrothermal vent metagenome TaxID=652676 RepID=A0A3B0RSH5_9ZZZZ
MAVSLISLSGSSRRRGQKYKPKAEINVTPMVDVMLVLLIVFMITATMLTPGVPVDLPKVDANALSTENEPLTITILADGQVLLMQTEIEVEALVPKLTAIAKNGMQERIFLRADKSVDYGTVMTVMAKIHGAGFVNLGLVTAASSSP